MKQALPDQILALLNASAVLSDLALQKWRELITGLDEQTLSKLLEVLQVKLADLVQNFQQKIQVCRSRSERIILTTAENASRAQESRAEQDLLAEIEKL